MSNRKSRQSPYTRPSPPPHRGGGQNNGKCSDRGGEMMSLHKVVAASLPTLHTTLYIIPISEWRSSDALSSSRSYVSYTSVGTSCRTCKRESDLMSEANLILPIQGAPHSWRKSFQTQAGLTHARTSVGNASVPHFGSGHSRRVTAPSRICVSKYSPMHFCIWPCARS